FSSKISSDAGTVEASAHALFITPLATAAGLPGALAFQMSGTVMFNVPIAAAQHLTDQLFQAPGPVTTMKDAIGRVLTGQWLRTDFDDYFGTFTDDVKADETGWHALFDAGPPRNAGTVRHETASQDTVVRVILIEHMTEIQPIEGTEEGWFDAGEIVD